ncbi:MAG: nicotinate-nucleotide adenylyltransferase [Armatimonadota bacterium]
MGIDDIDGSRRLAVMGGTFDPIHYAHLLIAEDVRERFELPHVLFMPSGSPPHKRDYEVTRAEDRYVMALLATAGNPHFSVSRLEIERPGPSYTIDTIRQLKAELGEGAQILFVTGADAVLEILTWHEPDAILDEARLVAVPRPGFDLEQLDETLGGARASKVTVIEAPLADISSTMIRRRVRAGASIRYLTPRPVVDYIQKRELYRVRVAERESMDETRA